MADRSVSVRLNARVEGYLAGVQQAKLATRDFANDAQKQAGKHKQSFDAMGKGMLVTGAAVAALGAVATRSFADFDQAMSRAQAGTMATGASLKALRDAAIDAGAKTQFSATEAAGAITAMGKAGVSTRDILGGGLTGALSLAAAGELDVASAAEIAATAMTQFNLEGSQLPHVADLLAAGAGKAQGSVQDLAGAMKYVGPVANGLGVSIEETTGVLAQFAAKGIIGEQAGTSMRGMLLSLTSPSKIAAEAMGNLGINMYDASGQFVGLQGAAGELQAKLGPLDDATRNAALGQLFGNEQITAARVLYEGGAESVADWTAKVDDAGFATRQAAMLTDNWRGDLERLGGSLSTVLIQQGSASNSVLRAMTQETQGLVDLYGGMPAGVQTTVAVLGAVVGAASLAAGGLLLLAPRIVATKVALADMGRTGDLLNKGMSGAGVGARLLGGPLALATVALGYFASQAQQSKGRVDELAASLDAQTSSITDNTRSWVAKNLSESGSLASAREMGVSVTDVTDAVLGNADALARVNAALALYGRSLAGSGGDISIQIDAMDKLRDAVGGGNDEVNRAVEKQKLLAQATGETGTATTAAVGPSDLLTGALADQGNAAKDAAKAVDELVKALADAGLVKLSARDAARQYESAIDDITKALKDNGRSLDIGTEKGRANQSALDDVAKAALAKAQATYEETKATKGETAAGEAFRGSLLRSRESLEASAVKMGMTRTAAKKYADQVLNIPTVQKTQFTTPGLDAAKSQVKTLRDLILGIPNRSVSISVATGVANKIAANPKMRAAGGPVWGAGTATSDSIDAKLSDGEYVQQTSAHNKYGTRFMDAVNAGQFPAELAAAFAVGGQVGSDVVVRGESPGSVAAAMGPVVAALQAAAASMQGAMGGGSLGGSGWQRQMAILRGQFPGLPMNSGPRPGARTVSGNQSYHAQGRAVDVPPSMATFNWIAANYGRSTKELIYTPAGGRQIKNGQPHQYTGAVAAMHNNHVHWAYARGGQVGAKPRRFAVGGKVGPTAAQSAAADLARTIAGNRQEWAFDHRNTAAQLADLNKRIAAERAYTDEWMALQAKREQIVDAANAKRRESREDARTAAASIAENRRAYAFEWMTVTAQIADLDRRLGAEKKFTDAWMSLQGQRQALAEQVAEKDRAAKGQAAEREQAAREQAARAAAEYASMLTANRATYTFERLSTEAQIADLDRRIGAEAKFTDTWMTLTAQRLSMFEQVTAAEAAAREATVRAASEYQSMLATNQAGWVFEHASAEQQVADLDARIGAEQQFTDTWTTLMRQREQIAGQMAAQDVANAQAAASVIAEAERVAQDYAQMIATNTAQYMFDFHKTTDEQIADLDRRIAAEAGFTDRWMQMDSQRRGLIERRDEAARAAREAAMAATPKGPVETWSLPQIVAGVYGARPMPTQRRSIVVKIGERELDSMMYDVADAQLGQLSDGVTYGSR